MLFVLLEVKSTPRCIRFSVRFHLRVLNKLQGLLSSYPFFTRTCMHVNV